MYLLAPAATGPGSKAASGLIASIFGDSTLRAWGAPGWVLSWLLLMNMTDLNCYVWQLCFQDHNRNQGMALMRTICMYSLIVSG